MKCYITIQAFTSHTAGFQKYSSQTIPQPQHRLSQDHNINRQYSDFMRDNQENEHMEIVPKSNQNTPCCYYIPHHGILHPESETTKAQIVFETGQSLNTI